MSKSSSTYKQGYALSIGVGADLPVTEDDAIAIAELLVSPKHCAYPQDHVRLLTGKKASKEEVLKALDWLANVSSSDSTIIIFYSGHGMEFPEYYLLPNNYDPSKLQETAISGKVFSQKLQNIRAKKLLVLLDCCHAGGQAQIKSAIPSPLPEYVVNEFSKHSGRVILASSRKHEVSWTGNPLSVFTAAVIEAFKGRGASEQDGFARVLDIAIWVASKVAERTEDKQHPVLKVRDLKDNFSIAWYAAGKEQPYIENGYKPMNLNENQASINHIAQREIESWTHALENKRSNLLDMDERISSFVESAAIPLDLLRDRRETQEMIEELEEKIKGAKQPVVLDKQTYASREKVMDAPLEGAGTHISHPEVQPLAGSPPHKSRGIFKVAGGVASLGLVLIIAKALLPVPPPDYSEPNLTPEQLELPAEPLLSNFNLALFVSKNCTNMQPAIIDTITKEFTGVEGALFTVKSMDRNQCLPPQMRGGDDLQVNVECNEQAHTLQASFCIGLVKHPPEVYEPVKILLQSGWFPEQPAMQFTRILKALGHYMTSDFNKSEKYLTMAIKNTNDDQLKQKLRVYKANGQLFLRKYQQAEMLYKEILTTKKTAPVLNNLGIALANEDWEDKPEKEQQALSALNEALVLQPSYKLPYIGLAYQNIQKALIPLYIENLENKERQLFLKQTEGYCKQLQSLDINAENLFKVCMANLYLFTDEKELEKLKDFIPQNNWKTMAAPFWSEPLVVFAKYQAVLFYQKDDNREMAREHLTNALEKSQHNIHLERGRRLHEGLLEDLVDVQSGKSTAVGISNIGIHEGD